MKILLSIILLLILVSCSAPQKQINDKQQTFIEYVVLNKYSDYKGESKED